MNEAEQADIISARLRRCGMRLHPDGQGHWILKYGSKTLLAVNAEGKPLTLADLDRHTSRFGAV
jgi:hypothetical protein